MKLDLAKHILDIDGIAVGALIGRLHDAAASAEMTRNAAADRGTVRG